MSYWNFIALSSFLVRKSTDSSHVEVFNVNNWNGNIFSHHNSKLCDTAKYLSIIGKVLLFPCPRLITH